MLDGIRDGFVAGTMAQNPYGQAYIGAYALDLLAGGCTVKADAPWIKTPQTAHFIDSGTLLISSKNIDSYKDDLKALTAQDARHLQGHLPLLQVILAADGEPWPPSANSSGKLCHAGCPSRSEQ